MNVMGTSPITRFNCSTCGSHYTLVRVDGADKPDSSTDDCTLSCTVCGAPLPAHDGQFILKYFLMRKSGVNERQRYRVV